MAPSLLAICWVLSSAVATVAADLGSRQPLAFRRAAIAQRQNAPDDCTLFDSLRTPDQDCAALAAYWGITEQTFISWVRDPPSAPPASLLTWLHRILRLEATVRTSSLGRNTALSVIGAYLIRRAPGMCLSRLRRFRLRHRQALSAAAQNTTKLLRAMTVPRSYHHMVPFR